MRSLINYVAVAWLVVSFLGVSSMAQAGSHPGLTMSAAEVKSIRAQLHSVPKAKQAFDALRATTDSGIEAGVIVPIPVDATSLTPTLAPGLICFKS